MNAFTPHLHAHNSVRATALRTKAMLGYTQSIAQQWGRSSFIHWKTPLNI